MRKNSVLPSRFFNRRVARALILCSLGNLGGVIGLAASGEQPYTRPGRTEQISVASDGTPGNAQSESPAISADARYVAFDSNATNLVANDTNNASDVFLRDRLRGTTVRLSVASDGTESNGDSWGASISADGRYVAFTSSATNLVPGDTNAAYDVFVHDVQTGITQRVSIASDGTQSNGDSQWAKISANARYLAFGSFGSNLVSNDTNGTYDVFVHDLQTGVTQRVSVGSDGSQFNGDSWLPAIDGDGGVVAFASPAVNGPNNLNDYGGYDVFVHDMGSGITQRVSVAPDGTQGLGYSYNPTISADGRHVAFASAARNLVPGDSNGAYNVFVRDLQTGITERTSVNSDGTEDAGDSGWPSVSADGRYVAFYMSPSSGDLPQDVYVRDMVTQSTELVSKNSQGTQGDMFSQWPSISADGRYVAFESFASNLVPGGSSNYIDVYIHDRGPALGPGGETVTQIGNAASISGWATFSGAVISSATDPTGDEPGADIGDDLIAASVIYRPENADLLVKLNLATLPGINGTTTPNVTYGLRFLPNFGPSFYEVRASYGVNGPTFGLFQCDPTCVQQASLTGGIGTAGVDVLISVPFAALGISEGTTLTQMQAFTVLEDIVPGTETSLDQMDLPDATVPERSVSFGVAPIGVPESQVDFNSLAMLNAGNFTGNVELPPNYLLWTRACLGATCSPAISWPLQLTSVVSRKIHGGAGTYDIDFTNGNGIESRSGGANGDHMLVFAFVNPLISVESASVTSGTGSVSSRTIDLSDPHNYIVNLTGVTNAQVVTVTLTNLTDSVGNFSSTISVSMGVLLGDVNGSRRVDAADVSTVRQQTLQPVTPSNFREDINVSGRIDAADVSIARQQTLTSLP